MILYALVVGIALVLVYDGVSHPTRNHSRSSRVERLVRESGIRGLTVPRLMAACSIVGLVSFVLVAGLTGSGTVGVAVAAACSYAPISMTAARRRRRRHRLREAWPHALATMVSGVRAGRSLPEAVADLVRRGPDDLREPCRAFAATYRATGSFARSLDRLRLELEDPIGDRVCVALALADEVGGTELVRLLRTTGELVRDDLRVRKEIEARWSWTTSAARVAAAAPWVVLGLLSLQPAAASAYNTVAGAVVLALGATASLTGYRLMLLIGRLPDDRRLA